MSDLTEAKEPVDVGKPNLRFAVATTAEYLQNAYLGGSTHSAQATARAQLARLRKLAGQPVDRDPLAVNLVLSVMQPQLSELELGKGDSASASERAAFHALTLFAVHMQGATSAIHVKSASFASACGRLNQISESESIKPRFDAMILAQGSRSRLIHARSLITLLRSNHLGFDYGQFAQDLRNLDNRERRNGVLLRWGRDFAIGHPSGLSPEETSPETHH